MIMSRCAHLRRTAKAVDVGLQALHQPRVLSLRDAAAFRAAVRAAAVSTAAALQAAAALSAAAIGALSVGVSAVLNAAVTLLIVKSPVFIS